MNLIAAITEHASFSSFLVRDVSVIYIDSFPLSVHLHSVFLFQTLAQDGITFSTAVSKLTNTPVIAPSYIIVGGIGPNEGAVITRGREHALDVWHLNVSDNRYNIYCISSNSIPDTNHFETIVTLGCAQASMCDRQMAR